MARLFADWRSALALKVFTMSAFMSAMAYKKPTFCDQDTDPFSFLWRIKRDPPSYLFGTIHVPYTKVWDYVPDNAKQAFASSQHVYFELDLVNPTTVSALSTCQMLPPGKNLSDVLPGDLYSRLKKHLEYVRGMMPHWMTADQRGRGLYADYLFNAIAGNWERKRPVWVMLMVNSLTESDVQSRGVPVLDLYLAQEAERLRKKTAAVEKVEEQCLPLNGLNFSQVLFALNHTLIQHEELRENDLHSAYTTDDLIRHYNCGDLNAGVFGQDSAPLPTIGNWTLSEEEAAFARNIDRYFRQELIYNRNLRMGTRVAQLVERNPGQSLFFAFGAGHFLGNNTVLDFVQAHGLEIEHLAVTSKIPRSKSKKSIKNDSRTLQKLSGSSKESLLSQKRNSYRRTNRFKSIVASSLPRSSSSMGLKRTYDTTTQQPTTTSERSRRFNDLWVRMDTYGRMKNSVLRRHSDFDQSPRQAPRTWFAANHLLEPLHSSSRTLSFATASLISQYICLSSFHLWFTVTALTGIT